MSKPLYQTALQTITDRIVSGELAPGAMLPSEKELGAQLGMSQGTMRKALSMLEDKGILQRRQGLGTFVATTTPESDLFQFFKLRDKAGAQVVPTLLQETIRRRASRAPERSRFGADCERVFELRRIRAVDDMPIVRETIVLPMALYPGLQERGDLPNTLYALFQQAYGIRVVQADEQLKAVLAEKDDAQALGVATGSPLLEVNRSAIDMADRIVEMRSSRYVTDKLHYEVSLR